ncbi:hypothetical protein WJX74_000223 [Apatococcus lobatus]|uniref:Uncharacterized protein n=1 Tax=Apatococcus lobatus TaxID=904363 RepID=A0AAW1RTD3_9CHLO
MQQAAGFAQIQDAATRIRTASGARALSLASMHGSFISSEEQYLEKLQSLMQPASRQQSGIQVAGEGHDKARQAWEVVAEFGAAALGVGPRSAATHHGPRLADRSRRPWSLPTSSTWITSQLARNHIEHLPSKSPGKPCDLESMEERKEWLLRHEIPRLCSELAALQDTPILQADYEAKLARQRRRLDDTARLQELLTAQAKRLADARAGHAHDVMAGIRAREGMLEAASRPVPASAERIGDAAEMAAEHQNGRDLPESSAQTSPLKSDPPAAQPHPDNADPSPSERSAASTDPMAANADHSTNTNGPGEVALAATSQHADSTEVYAPLPKSVEELNSLADHAADICSMTEGLLEHDSLKGMQALLRKLQKLLLPDGVQLLELLEQEQVSLRPAESEEAMQQLDKANVKLANELQQLMQEKANMKAI